MRNEEFVARMEGIAAQMEGGKLHVPRRGSRVSSLGLMTVGCGYKEGGDPFRNRLAAARFRLGYEMAFIAGRRKDG